jgi:hypothetical protein
MAQAQRWSDGVQLQDRSPRRSGRIDHQTSPRSLIDMRTICCSYVPVYFCHIVTAADGYPCAVGISIVMIFFVVVEETRSVHFVLCLFMCILHFVPVCHKKKKAMAMLCQQRDGRSFSGKTVFKNHTLACAFRHEVFSPVPECRNE